MAEMTNQAVTKLFFFHILSLRHTCFELQELCRSGRGQSLRVKQRVDLQRRLAQKGKRESCRRWW